MEKACLPTAVEQALGGPKAVAFGCPPKGEAFRIPPLVGGAVWRKTGRFRPVSPGFGDVQRFWATVSRETRESRLLSLTRVVLGGFHPETRCGARVERRSSGLLPWNQQDPRSWERTGRPLRKNAQTAGLPQFPDHPYPKPQQVSSVRSFWPDRAMQSREVGLIGPYLR